MTERDAVTSALAGPLVKARATSRGPAPCAPTPGSSNTERGSSFLASATTRGAVAPTTAPTLERPRSPVRSAPQLRDELGHLLPDAPPVGERQLLDIGRAGVRRAHEAEDARSVQSARLQEGLDGVAAEIGVDGERVGERRLVVARLEIGGGVGARRRADVAALAVGDHEQPRRARVAADPLERADPVGAERLEERHLRLDRDDVRADRVDDPAAEAGDRVRRLAAAEHRLAAQLDGQQVEPRIEPDHELAALPLHRLREPVGEGRGGHGRHERKATRLAGPLRVG